MTNTQNLEPSQEPQEPTLLELIESVDKARHDFLVASLNYKNFPKQGNLANVIDTANNTNQAVITAVVHILSDDINETTESKSLMVTSILKEDDERRVDHFNRLLKKEEFEKIEMTEINFAQYVTGLLESEDEDVNPAAVVLNTYLPATKADVERFILLVSESKRAKRLKIATQVGKKGLELAVVGGVAGSTAAIGAWLAVRKRT